jgi:hypothetical protein
MYDLVRKNEKLVQFFSVIHLFCRALGSVGDIYITYFNILNKYKEKSNSIQDKDACHQ